jgi:hypothetical protein
MGSMSTSEQGKGLVFKRVIEARIMKKTLILIVI